MSETESVSIPQLVPDDVRRVSSVLGLARLYQGDGVYLVAWVGDEPVGHVHLALTDPPVSGRFGATGVPATRYCLRADGRG